jgi:hypothetical protein
LSTVSADQSQSWDFEVRLESEELPRLRDVAQSVVPDRDALARLAAERRGKGRGGQTGLLGEFFNGILEFCDVGAVYCLRALAGQISA